MSKQFRNIKLADSLSSSKKININSSNSNIMQNPSYANTNNNGTAILNFADASKATTSISPSS